MKQIIIFLYVILLTSCTTYNYLGDTRLMAPVKKDTIPDIIILPFSFPDDSTESLFTIPLNIYPGAEEYLIPKPIHSKDLFDIQRFIDSCIIVNNIKILHS